MIYGQCTLQRGWNINGIVGGSKCRYCEINSTGTKVQHQVLLPSFPPSLSFNPPTPRVTVKYNHKCLFPAHPSRWREAWGASPWTTRCACFRGAAAAGTLSAACTAFCVACAYRQRAELNGGSASCLAICTERVVCMHANSESFPAAATS